MAYSDRPLFGAPDPRLAQVPISHKQTVSDAQPSMIDRLFTGQPQPPSGLADLSSILGGFSSGEKANRVVRGNITSDYDKMLADLESRRNVLGNAANSDYNTQMLAAARARNENEADAWRKLGQTSYVLGGGSKFKMPTLSYGGQSMTPPSFGLAPQAPSEADMAGAKTLQDTIMSRFGEEGSYMPSRFTPIESFTPHTLEEYGTKPGFLENLGSYGGAIAGGIGALDKIAGGGGSAIGKLLGKIPGLSKLGGGGGGMVMNAAGIPVPVGSMGGGVGPMPPAMGGSTIGRVLGKAAPIAGAALGTYGLMKDRGLAGNVMNGAMAGAGYGSFIPGIGTAIGAGLGAGVGALRGIGGPSTKEKEGRTIGTQAVEQLSAGATPQQMQEAQSAGWGDKTPDALASIVMRDQLIAAGKDPNSAGMYLNMIKQAEKAGPQAVQGVIQRIMQDMGEGQQPGQFGSRNAVARPTMPGIVPGGPGTYRG